MVDILVFGASGFTGEHVLEAAIRAGMDETRTKSLKIVAAGRNRLRVLQAVRRTCNAKRGVTAQEDVAIDAPWPDEGVFVRVAEADASDQMACDRLAAFVAKGGGCVIGCVGPFRLYGRAMVAACAREGANYVDISGEPDFMERSEAELGAEAARNGCTLVSACGMDSVPADLGAAVSVARSGGASQVEAFLNVIPPPGGLRVNFATYESAVYGFGSVDDLRALRKARERAHPDEKQPPKPGKKRAPLALAPSPLKGLLLPFPGADASVVRRTQRTWANDASDAHPKPYGFSAYALIPSTFWAYVTALLGIIFGLVASFEWGRKILLACPGLFTCGVFRHERPPRSLTKNTGFQIHFRTTSEDGKDKWYEFTAKDPGYTFTAACVVACALCLANRGEGQPLLRSESKSSAAAPKGATTPGVAFFHLAESHIFPFLERSVGASFRNI